MAKKPTKRAYLLELDRLAPTIRNEYLEWVGERVGIAKISQVEAFVRTGNVEGILTSLDITTASLGELTEAIRSTYKDGGKFEAPAAQVSFDMRNPAAESWLRNTSSELVTNIVASQRNAIRATLEEGMIAGNNPRTTALDIVGRVNPTTGRRKGGIVGLTEPQARYVANARTELSSPSLMRSYLTRKARDHRFDAMVNRAIQTGRPLTPRQIQQIAGRYSDKLLKLRGDTIARTESIHAFNAARDQAWDQSIGEGKVDKQFVTGKWSSTMDGGTRHSHVGLNGQMRPHNVPFLSPTGALMLYPGDTSMGAHSEDVINCRCFLQKEADFLAQAVARNGV